jgi:hypothetical protein
LGRPEGADVRQRRLQKVILSKWRTVKPPFEEGKRSDSPDFALHTIEVTSKRSATLKGFGSSPGSGPREGPRGVDSAHWRAAGKRAFARGR